MRIVSLTKHKRPVKSTQAHVVTYSAIAVCVLNNFYLTMADVTASELCVRLPTATQDVEIDRTAI